MKIPIATKEGEEISVEANKIEIPIYGQIVWLVVGQKEKIQKFDSSLKVGAMLSNEATSEIIIWIEEFEISVLVHELYHAVESLTEYLLLGRVGVAEAQAYLMGYLVEEALKKNNKKWLIK